MAPTSLKFTGRTSEPQIVALQIRLKNSYLMRKMATDSSNTPKPELYRHLLCARIKHTNFVFSYYLETLITAETAGALAE